MPGGLEARLAADGSGLSVGQWQRVALARTILVQADLVLLDEPTAALDTATEAAVADAIGRLAARGATVIVVAHRPALVGIADQVLRLDRPVASPPAGTAAASAAEVIRGTGW
ncbi:MAG: ATP-binding cassette domain-containing protein [Candidatus Nanopelagicales bacterium]